MGRLIDTSLLYESGYNKGFKDGIKGSIPKDQYEARLKADSVAMLTEIQLEIQKYSGCSCSCSDGVVNDIDDLIQEKIDALKGEDDESKLDES